MQESEIQLILNKITTAQESTITMNAGELYLAPDTAVYSVNNVAPVSGNVTISIPTDTNDLTNGAGFITGITSSDVTTALGYTPYSSANPNGYTSNVGTVTSVNNVSPVNGNVTLSIPSEVTETTVSGWGFTKNVGTVTKVNNVSPVNGNVTIDTSDIFIATYNSTSFSDILSAYNAGKTIICKSGSSYLSLSIASGNMFKFSGFIVGGLQEVEVTVDGNDNTIWSITQDFVPQPTSTAVTHTASTAVGSSTQPVYIASDGTATVCSSAIPTVNNATLTIQKNGTTVETFTANASSDVTCNITVPTQASDISALDTDASNLSATGQKVFDGQFVQSYSALSTNTVVGSYSHDLSEYLPNDNYSYAVTVSLSINSANTTYLTVGNAASPSGYIETCWSLRTRSTANARSAMIQGEIPIGTGRYLYSQISGADASSSTGIYLIGYRRIGTNS